MKIEYSQNAADVRPLFERWQEVCRAGEFGFALSIELAQADLAAWLATQDGTLIIAREDDGGAPIGFLAIFAVASTISTQRVGLEKYWYADPNRALVGPKLFCKARDWATEQGCSHLLLAASNLSSDHYESVVRFCKDVGMEEFETTFIMRLGD